MAWKKTQNGGRKIHFHQLPLLIKNICRSFPLKQVESDFSVSYFHTMKVSESTSEAGLETSSTLAFPWDGMEIPQWEWKQLLMNAFVSYYQEASQRWSCLSWRFCQDLAPSWMFLCLFSRAVLTLENEEYSNFTWKTFFFSFFRCR